MNTKSIFYGIAIVLSIVIVILISILIIKVAFLIIKVKKGNCTIKQKQQNRYYQYALKKLQEYIIFEIFLIAGIVLFINVINANIQYIYQYIQRDIFITILLELLILINYIIVIKKSKEAKRLLIYDNLIENNRVYSTENSKLIYDYNNIFEILENNKLYLDCLLERANKDYDMIKFLSPIPIISLLTEIAFKYLNIVNFDAEVFTAIIIAMIFTYILFIIITNQKVKNITYEIYRNNECYMKMKSRQEKD